MFVGTDASGHGSHLWVTNGTSVGTSELAVSGADTSSLGLVEVGSAIGPSFTNLNGKVLFEGLDGNGHLDLWVTDGIGAGTMSPFYLLLHVLAIPAIPGAAAARPLFCRAYRRSPGAATPRAFTHRVIGRSRHRRPVQRCFRPRPKRRQLNESNLD